MSFPSWPCRGRPRSSWKRPKPEREAELRAARAAGYEEGLAAGRAEVSGAARALAAAAAELHEARASAADDAEPVAVELALQIAAKVLGGATRGASRSWSSTWSAGRSAGSPSPSPPPCSSTPRTPSWCATRSPSCSVEHGGELSVRDDRRVERGGCIVSTAAGEIDAQIAAQLERAAKVVAERSEPE